MEYQDEQGVFRLNTIYKSPVNVLSVYAFRQDKDESIRMAQYLFSREFLPMPCHNSPVLCALKPKTWHPKVADSMEILSMTYAIIRWYSECKYDDWYQKNTALVKQAREDFGKNIEALEQTFRDKIKPIYFDLKEKVINEKEALTRFVNVLTFATIERIRVHETCMKQMFKMPDGIPLTPHDFLPDLPMMRWDDAGKFLKHYFANKEEIRHVRMERETSGYVRKRLFNVDEIPDRIQNWPRDEVWRNFFDRMTAWEYFKFLDYDDILV